MESIKSKSVTLAVNYRTTGSPPGGMLNARGVKGANPWFAVLHAW
jgi:hypothetical protein